MSAGPHEEAEWAEALEAELASLGAEYREWKAARNAYFELEGTDDDPGISALHDLDDGGLDLLYDIASTLGWAAEPDKED